MVCRTLEALAASCNDSLQTLDVNGCSGIAARDRATLQKLLPNLRNFVVHS